MSFIFNGIDSRALLTTNTVGQSILPPVTTKMVAVPKRAGAFDFGTELGVRQIDVAVTIKAATWEELRAKARTLADWLYQDDLKPLVFNDEPELTYMARIAGGTDHEEIVFNGQGTITFMCPEPYAAGQQVSQTVAVAKPEPVFTRASAAYDDNLAAYAMNQPRYKAGQHGQALLMEGGVTNLLQTADTPAEEALTLTPCTFYALSSSGTDQAVIIEHGFTDDLTTGPKSGTYNQGTDLTLTLNPSFNDIDTAQTDFSGTHGNTVATIEGNVELTKTASGVNYNKTETTQADFQLGTHSNTVATSGGEVELATEQVATNTKLWKNDTFESSTRDPFYTWNAAWARSTARAWQGSYSHTATTWATSTFTTPAGVTSVKMSFPYYVSTGNCSIFLNNVFQTTTSAGTTWRWYVADLLPNTTYTIGIQSGDGYAYRVYVDDFYVEWYQSGNVTQYISTGNRASAAVDISTVGVVASSSISWTQILPSANTTVRVDISLDGGTNWTLDVANGATIPGLEAEVATAGKSLKWRTVFSTSNLQQTPKVSDITVSISTKDQYNTTGTYISQQLTLPAATVMASTINWTDVIPSGAGVTVQTNYAANGITWAGWVTATKGGGIAGLSNGTVIATGAKLQYRVTMTPTADRLGTPQLQDLTLNISRADTGTRTSTALDVANVETYYTSVVSWTATVPAGTSLTVEISVDNGGSWQAATNGGAISGLTLGQTLAGKTILTRATLATLTTPEPPTLHGLTVKVMARKTGGLFNITPATSAMKLTPSGITKWQLEPGQYATTWTPNTRAPEYLSLDMGGGLESAQGTFEVRAYEDGHTAHTYFLWDSYGTDMGSRFLLQKQTNGTYTLHFNNALAITAPTLASVGHHVFAARWNGNQVWLLIDGVEKGTATLAAPVDMSKNQIIYLGSRHSGVSYWDNAIDEMRASRIARTDIELAAHATGGPLPLDENTICLLNFDGNLGVGAVENPSLTYNGTARTYPIFTLEVKAPISYVKLMKGSKHILVTHSFQAGDVLVSIIRSGFFLQKCKLPIYDTLVMVAALNLLGVI